MKKYIGKDGCRKDGQLVDNYTNDCVLTGGLCSCNLYAEITDETIKEQSNSVSISLEDAANSHASEMYDGFDEEQSILWENRKTNFIEGANWQKEQYNSLLNSYRELLQCIEEIKWECDGYGVINQTWLLNKCQSALNNGDNILSKFNQ